MSDWLSRKGFDAARLRFAFRTALACFLAIVLAWLMGLEHPQWAGMSVWAASQPLRGQLLEKSFFRFVGTLAGTGVGILLVIATQVHPAVLIVGLALWVGACTWLGNLQRGLVAYGTVLAGYSASMVVLVDTAHPERVFHLGADRLATVLTGVLVATLVGYFFAKRTDEADLRGRILRLLANLLRDLADPVGARHDSRKYLSDLAAIEEGLDPHAAGSFQSRRDVRRARGILLATVPLLLHGRAPLDPVASERFAAAARALERGDVATARSLLRASDTPEFHTVLHDLVRALGAWDQAFTPDPTKPARSRALPVALHRDWIGAREAGLRAGGAMLLFGAAWLVTGWQAGAFMLLGLSVMISLFSTFENPAITMRHIFVGQLLGVLGALVCRWLVWPHAESELQQILLLFPFIMLGPFLVAHRKTVIAATDYSMILLLLSQPRFPLTGGLQDSLVIGLAVLAGPLAAWAGYLLVFPINLKRRQQHLLAMMWRDLASIATSPQALVHRAVWQARMYHRVLRLVRISERQARAEEQAHATGSALLLLTHAAMRCHELWQSAETPHAIGRAARVALAQLSRTSIDPSRTAAAFHRLAGLLQKKDAEFMLQAADSVVQIAGSRAG